MSFDKLRNYAVWLMFAISFVVTIEPAPVDVMFILVFLCFLRSGLSITIGAAPLALFLILYNIGGFVSFIEVSNERKAVMFVFTSSYMAITGVVLSYYIAHDPMERFKYVKSGLCVGAFIAACFGLLDYFDIGGLIPHGNIAGRATGLFKDPNVFSTYLIFPAIMLIQGLMLGTTKRKFLSLVGLLTIIIALFLAFSRGAWINFAGAALLLVALTYIVNSQDGMRSRIMLSVIAGAFVTVAGVGFMLSFPEIRETFIERFSLFQTYDAGETGRFGIQLNSIPVLLGRPFGFGPTYFRIIFGQDPHNTFLNAFASYGWLGGISFFCMIISTLIIGVRTVFTRTPWQNMAIVVFCPLLTTILQGVQIDTEHWRHFYWMLGLMWGLFAATLQPSAVIGGWAAIGMPQRDRLVTR